VTTLQNAPATRSDAFNTIHDWLADHILQDEPTFRHLDEIEILLDRLGYVRRHKTRLCSACEERIQDGLGEGGHDCYCEWSDELPEARQ
jgi:hypothetical protein